MRPDVYTKGPWKTERIGNDIEISAQTDHGHLSVAWVHMGDERDPTQDEACRIDAHLIAAAPEMFEALKEAFIVMAGKEGSNSPFDLERWAKAVNGVEEAIAKAAAVHETEV